MFRRLRKGRTELNFSQIEQDALNRELEESRKSAMPSNTSSNAFSGGNFVTSKLRLAVNQNGLLGIVSRRIFEPRKSLPKENHEEL